MCDHFQSVDRDPLNGKPLDLRLNYPLKEITLKEIEEKPLLPELPSTAISKPRNKMKINGFPKEKACHLLQTDNKPF